MKKVILALTLGIVCFSNSTLAQEFEETQEFVARTTPGSSNIESIQVRAVSTTEQNTSNYTPFGESSAATPHEVDVATLVTSDAADPQGSESALRRKGFYSLARKLKAKTIQVIQAPRSVFSDWFKNNRRRLTIISLEFSFISGVKYTELLLSPQPIQEVPALVAALLIGGTIGLVEWNTPALIRYITTSGSLVKQLFKKISGVAKSEAAQQKISKTLDIFWQFSKNTFVNFSLFNAVRIILYASTEADGSGLERLWGALDSTTFAHLGDSASMALASTVLSFPTTKVIISYRDRLIKKAGTNEALLLRARDQVTLAMSSALTARALLFCSKIVAVSYHMPQLDMAANALLGTLFVGSIWKLIADGKKTATCSAIHDPQLRKELNESALADVH